MKVLVGDIGGTKTVFQVVEVQRNHQQLLFEHCFLSAEYTAFNALLRDLLTLIPADVRANIASFCLGVAGPISHDKQTSRITNLPWKIELNDVKKQLGINKAALINDFEAIGQGITALSDVDLLTLQKGKPQREGHRAIIGAGTGLGVGQLRWSKTGYDVMPSEGGHADFAPNDEEQVKLLNYLFTKYQNPSWEQVVSGQGLINIYAFLRETTDLKASPEAQHLMHQVDDVSAEIYRLAIEDNDPLSIAAMALFVRAYGSQAGNVALTVLPYGGLYISGGIAPKILDFLVTGAFMKAFKNKSKMRALLEQIPVYVVLNSKVGMLGAVAVAARL